MPSRDVLVLEDYLPYRLALLSGQIGLTGARLYRQYFGFGLREWRIVAVLGPEDERSLSDLSRLAKIDTGTATRALATLYENGMVEKRDDGEDQRKVQFKLAKKGIETYKRVVAGALEREALLTEALSAKDRKELLRLLELLEVQALKLETFDPYAADHLPSDGSVSS